MSDPENTRRLVLAIIDFLQNQLITRNDLSLEDREGLEIAMECLILAYDIENTDYIPRRPLLDMFTQVANPVSIENKIQAESHKTSGNDKITQEQYKEAEEEYSRAIQLDKWNAVYYCNRASARIKMEQYFEAITDCREALSLNPDYAKAHARMGQAYALMNRPRRAARCYRQALELDPDNERYRNNLRVAESQAAEQPNMDMGNLINSIVSSLFMGGPPMPGGSGMTGAGPSFMIIGDPHTQDQCTSHSSHGSSDDPSATGTNNAGENQNGENNKPSADKKESNETSERRNDDDTVHFRVVFGIPSMSDEGNSSQDSKSRIHHTMGNRSTEEKSKNGQQSTVPEEAQKEVGGERRNGNNKNGADGNNPQKGSSNMPGNSKNEDKLGKNDMNNTNTDDKRPNNESSKEQEKPKTESIKNNIQNWAQGFQNSLFGRMDHSRRDKKNQSVKKDLERQKNNSNVNQTEQNGQPAPSQRNFTFQYPEGDARQKNSRNLTQTGQRGQPGSSQRFSSQYPEGDSREPQQPLGISMSDISNFFHNISRSDVNAQENANQHKQSSTTENEKINDQKDKDPQGQASASPENHSDQLPIPEKKPSKEKEKEQKAGKEEEKKAEKEEKQKAEKEKEQKAGKEEEKKAEKEKEQKSVKKKEKKEEKEASSSDTKQETDQNSE